MIYSILLPSGLILSHLTSCSTPGTSSDALYRELWHACAGPLVNLPLEGERVYYFPEGHMEQVDSAESFEFMLLLMNLTLHFSSPFSYVLSPDVQPTAITQKFSLQKWIPFFFMTKKFSSFLVSGDNTLKEPTPKNNTCNVTIPIHTFKNKPEPNFGQKFILPR